MSFWWLNICIFNFLPPQAIVGGRGERFNSAERSSTFQAAHKKAEPPRV